MDFIVSHLYKAFGTSSSADVNLTVHNEIMTEVCIGLAEVTEGITKVNYIDYQKKMLFGQAKQFRVFAKMYKCGGSLNGIKKSN